MILYSHQGKYPQRLLYRIRLSDGRTRTNPSNFTPEEIIDAGYISVSDKPSITDAQVLSWSTELIDWVIRDKTTEELAAEEQNKNNILSAKITQHRDMLIASGFWFNDVKYDSRPEDQKRISGAGLLAFIAISQGAQPGNLYWHGGTSPFSWITQNNDIVEMDAYTVIEFGKAAAEHERSHIFAARSLKDLAPIPENYTDASYWPSTEPVSE